MEVKRHIYTITELTKEIRALLEGQYPSVWAEGEISNLRQPSSGHMYFTLKDADSQIAAVIFRGVNHKIKFKLEDGMRVICFGSVTVYEKNGQYQLMISSVEPKGIGALQLALEQLKIKLQKEGLFEESHKVPIPFLPSTIGVVTSATGAAIREILKVARRRYQNIEIILRPVKVQGEGAAEEIALAIDEFNEFNKAAPGARHVDVLIVGRGGGSLEDLWAFNEETVARAIYGSKIPVISAVGHEIDWTISDLVADKRAPTPSAAAEIEIPEKGELKALINGYVNDLKNSILGKLDLLTEKFARLRDSYILRRPREMVIQYQQRIDDLAAGLHKTVRHIVVSNDEKYRYLAGKLEVLSPLGILNRGYSITTRPVDGRILKDASSLKPGDCVKTRLGRGAFTSKVEIID